MTVSTFIQFGLGCRCGKYIVVHARLLLIDEVRYRSVRVAVRVVPESVHG
jgi:hypothetical protein